MSSVHKPLPASPPRSRPSAALWAHLIRREPVVPRSHTDGPNTPIAPVDKTGTSTRMLLHDTQANLEAFSTRVDALTKSVGEAKTEIVLVKKLFEQEHDKLSGEIIDLVNRCQTEVQKTVGAPAQRDKLEALCKDFSVVDGRIEALDRRMDAIHMLNQTQNQALQSIQDQQGKILSALLPLLPLIQALPLHIDAARNDVKEIVAASQAVMLDKMETAAPKPLVESNKKRSSSLVRPPFVTPARKRIRLDGESNLPKLPRSLSRTATDAAPSPISKPGSPADLQDVTKPLSRHATLEIGPRSENTHSSANQQQPSALETPRQPLADLPLGPLSNFNMPSPTARVSPHPKIARTTSSSSIRSPALVSPQASARTATASRATAQKAPLFIRIPKRKADSDTHTAVRSIQVQPPSSLADAIDKTASPACQSANVNSSTLASRPSTPAGQAEDADVLRLYPAPAAVIPRCFPLLAQDTNVNGSPALSNWVVKPQSLKDISYRNEGKRFIPLDDDDDDDDEEDY